MTTDNHLRWIPAYVKQVEEIEAKHKKIRLFLPSFTRFVSLPPKAYIELKTSIGLARQFPVIATIADAQEILIEVKDLADEVQQDFYRNVSLDQLLEITAPFALQDQGDEVDFYVYLARQAVHLAIPKEKSISDVMREHQLKVNTSCEYGICGTCYTSVLEGEVIHHDSYLMEEEKAKQDCVMICVSRAKSGSTLVLDC